MQIYANILLKNNIYGQIQSKKNKQKKEQTCFSSLPTQAETKP